MILVVGAGFSGSVVARELADFNHKVHVIDKRSHIGGNAYDEYDDNGIIIHKYGPHIFHTNSDRIFEYLSRFTEWRKYEHKVKSNVSGVLYPFPINMDTINQLYNLNLNEEEVAHFFESVRIPIEHPQNSEEVVLNSVGVDLYKKFFYNYTCKQWGIKPNELKANVAARIPVRTNTDDRYFTDKYQVMPADGYTAMFTRILDCSNITVDLNKDFCEIDINDYEHVVYTGPIDEFFQYCFGRLPYRSLEFCVEHIADKDYMQEVGTINYPNDFDFTRVTEFKHLTGQVCNGTSIMYEYPKECSTESIPYYPVPSIQSENLYKKYDNLAKSLRKVTFVGRLAQYRYYNMDQVVAAALTTADRILKSGELV